MGDGPWQNVNTAPGQPYRVVSDGTHSYLYVGDTAYGCDFLTRLLNGTQYRVAVEGQTSVSGPRETVYSNAVGEQLPAYLYVNRLDWAHPYITHTPGDTVCEGDQKTFTVNLPNNVSSRAQIIWYKDGVAVQNSTSRTYKTKVYDGTSVWATVATGYTCPGMDPEPSDTVLIPAHIGPYIEALRDTAVN